MTAHPRDAGVKELQIFIAIAQTLPDEDFLPTFREAVVTRLRMLTEEWSPTPENQFRMFVLGAVFYMDITENVGRAELVAALIEMQERLKREFPAEEEES